MLRPMLKFTASRLSVDTLQRILAYPIQKKEFGELESVPAFANRERLWSHCLNDVNGKSHVITYVEFGVYHGQSIRYFAETNLCDASLFIGLDSFEGLPERWGRDTVKGYFSTNGHIPQIDDSRVHFIKGWFQDTWDRLAPQIAARDNLIVHYDADLYSSTLYALSKIDTLGKTYLAIFDEFTGHETRALYNYKQSFNASVSFLGKVLHEGYPLQVMCAIVPRVAQRQAAAQAIGGL